MLYSDFSVRLATANKFVLKITLEILSHARSLSSLPVCPLVVSFFKFYEHDTHDLLRTR